MRLQFMLIVRPILTILFLLFLIFKIIMTILRTKCKILIKRIILKYITSMRAPIFFLNINCVYII